MSNQFDEEGHEDKNWQLKEGDPFSYVTSKEIDNTKAPIKEMLKGEFVFPIPAFPTSRLEPIAVMEISKGGGTEPVIYRHKVHGGIYEHIGLAKPAGDCTVYLGNTELAIYRSLKTSELYFMYSDDFEKQMEKLE